MDLARPTSLSECALCIGLPVSREQFLDGLSAGSPRDFPKWYACTRGGAARLPSSIWDAYWEREGSQIVAAARDVEDLGVEVAWDCTIDDFSQLLRRKTVVTLLGHWKAPCVRFEDVTDAKGLLETLTYSSDPLMCALRRGLSCSGDVTSVPEESFEARVTALVDRINAVLQSVDLSNESARTPHTWQPARSYLANANRELLEPSLSPFVRASYGLDLVRGPHGARAVERAVPEDFSGLLELAVCNSAYVGDQIRKVRHDCRVIYNVHEVKLLFRAVLFREVVRMIQREGSPFLQAMQRIRTAMGER